jgi:hypothetical protein
MLPPGMVCVGNNWVNLDSLRSHMGTRGPVYGRYWNEATKKEESRDKGRDEREGS